MLQLSARSTWCGLDITCGNKSLNIYGGILIRELDFEDGSANVLTKLIRDSSAGKGETRWSDKEKKILNEINDSDIFSGDLRIVPVTENENADKNEEEEDLENNIIYAGERILTANQVEKYPEYNKLSLRIACWQTSKKKKKMIKVKY